MKRKIGIIILLLILIYLIVLFIDKSIYKNYSKDLFYMDTYINIKLNTTESKKEIDVIFDDIDYLYSSYHKLTDRYHEYDGIINAYYLNELLPDNKEVIIDQRLADIIDIGIDYYNQTNGLFNIASGNLTEVWKEFIDDCAILPTTEDLNVNIDITDIKLNGNSYMKDNNVKIDLGAIAKGYVTELVGNYLEDNGIYSYVINAGGNVKVGNAYGKESFVIGITDPNDTSSIFTRVNINNKSVVTSGNYQRYCMLNGINYNHIINPKTRYPVADKQSVTVIGNSSVIADIYSTYLYILPLEDGLKLVNSNPDIEAIWYIDKDNILRSDNFNYE